MKKIRNLFIYLYALLFITSVPVHANSIEKMNTVFDKLKENIKTYTGYYYAFALLSVVLVLIILFVQLGGFHTRPFKRNEVIKNIGIVALCTALLGAVGLISTLFVGNFFKP